MGVVACKCVKILPYVFLAGSLCFLTLLLWESKTLTWSSPQCVLDVMNQRQKRSEIRWAGRRGSVLLKRLRPSVLTTAGGYYLTHHVTTLCGHFGRKLLFAYSLQQSASVTAISNAHQWRQYRLRVPTQENRRSCVRGQGRTSCVKTQGTEL